MPESAPREPRNAVLAFGLIMALPAFAIFHLVWFSFWYYWGKAPAVPLVLASAILLLYTWRSSRYLFAFRANIRRTLRGGRTEETNPPHRHFFITIPSPIERLTALDITEIGAWYGLTGLLYWHLHAHFGFHASLPDAIATKVVFLGYLGYFIAAFTFYPMLLWLAANVKALFESISAKRLLPTRILSMIFAYLVADLVFAAFYELLTVHSKESFKPPILTFLDALYFSTMTIATVGYGDFVPASAFAKILTICEVFLGILLLVVLLSAAISISGDFTNSSYTTRLTLRSGRKPKGAIMRSNYRRSRRHFQPPT